MELERTEVLEYRNGEGVCKGESLTVGDLEVEVDLIDLELEFLRIEVECCCFRCFRICRWR